MDIKPGETRSVEIKIKGTPRPALQVGTLQVVNMDTGEIVEERRNAMTLLPAAADKCQECGVDHAHDQPHDKQSLLYGVRFFATHGRAPTWSDAMAHCPPAVRAHWRRELVELMSVHGDPIPPDLIDPDSGEGVR